MDKKYCKVEISDQTDPLELEIMSGNLGPDVIDISNLYQENSLFTYDPGFVSTASCQSNITFIDGDKGLLLYRGYPVEELAKSSILLKLHTFFCTNLKHARIFRFNNSTYNVK